MAAPIISEEGRDLSRKKKHRVSDPGALVVEHAEPSDTGRTSACGGSCLSCSIRYNFILSLSGVYTCVAWNTEGADTKSISVFVDSQGSVGWWSEEAQQGVEPSREHSWNSSSPAASLVVLAKVPS